MPPSRWTLSVALWLLWQCSPETVRAQLDEPVTVFKSEVGLVEVYATVYDHRGQHVRGLTRERFEVRDEGEQRPIAAFETESSFLTCALVLDTSGSMHKALPVVKRAVLLLIDELREGDSVGIYGMSSTVRNLQGFTTDKSAAKRAVLRTRPAGRTALFDAISFVTRALSERAGKKALVVFTDGQDNASVLNPAAAMNRAKKAGIPVYTVAHGEALESRDLVARLKDLSQMTGGIAYAMRSSKQAAKIFQAISLDVQHMYMLAYRAPQPTERRWRKIEVSVKNLKKGRIRAKLGYFPSPFFSRADARSRR